MSRSWTLGAMACLTVVFGTSFGAAEPGVDPPAGEPSRDRPSVERVVDLDRDCRLAIDAGLARNDELAREIERQVRDVMARVQALIPAEGMTLHVKVSDASTGRSIIPELGIGGHPMGTDEVWMYVQPENPHFRPEHVAWGLPHEIHHAIRLRRVAWPFPLLEAFVMEGLADHFQREVTGREPGPWTRALSDEQAKQCLARVRPILLLKVESYAEFTQKYQDPWLMGRSDGEPIPRWAGYTLGWRIVEDYLRAHPEAKASSLVFERSEVIASATPGVAHLFSPTP